MDYSIKLETKINNKNVTINKNFSVKDAKFIISNLYTVSDYKTLFIKMLIRKLNSNIQNKELSITDIENISQEESEIIINYFLESTPRLKSMYIQDTEKDIYKKFIINMKKQCDECAIAYEKILSNFNNDYFSKIKEVITNNLTNAIKIVSEKINNIYDNLPTLEEIELNIDKYKKWAEFGWVLGYGDINIKDIPDDIIEQDVADKIIESKYTDEKINELFKSLKQLTNHEYLLHNAIKDYQDKNYLGSILIISSIIDRILSENFEPLNRNKRKRAIGTKGTEALYDKYSKNPDNYSFPEIYVLEPLKIVLENFFHDAEDFTFESKGIINRNLISHGWYDNIITKTDCLKFLNLLGALQMVIFYKFYE